MGNQVSVIIPTYNRAGSAVRAVESVLSQTYANLDVIVVDDGSTDDTGRLLEQYARRIRYLKLPHRGLPAISRNEGLKAARGEFIAFLDDDDTWHQNKLEKQLECMEQTQTQAICSNAHRIRDNRQDDLFFPSSENRPLRLRELLMDNKLITSSVVLHRSITDKIGYFPESPKLKAMEDYAYWLRAVVYAPIYYLDEPLVAYTDNPSQSVRSYSTSEYLSVRTVMVNFASWCLRKIWMPAAWRALGLLFLQHSRREYFWYRSRS